MLRLLSTELFETEWLFTATYFCIKAGFKTVSMLSKLVVYFPSPDIENTGVISRKPESIT